MRKMTEEQLAEKKSRNIGEEILQGIRDIKAGRFGRRYTAPGVEKKDDDSASPPITEAEVLSAWADRKERPDEIARQLRRRNRRHR